MTYPRGARGPRVDAHALRKLRIEAGLTQVDLGGLANVDPSHISRLEAGQRTYPSPRTCKALADALGVAIPSLLADALGASR